MYVPLTLLPIAISNVLMVKVGNNFTETCDECFLLSLTFRWDVWANSFLKKNCKNMCSAKNLQVNIKILFEMIFLNFLCFIRVCFANNQYQFQMGQGSQRCFGWPQSERGPWSTDRHCWTCRKWQIELAQRVLWWIAQGFWIRFCKRKFYRFIWSSNLTREGLRVPDAKSVEWSNDRKLLYYWSFWH